MCVYNYVLQLAGHYINCAYIEISFISCKFYRPVEMETEQSLSTQHCLPSITDIIQNSLRTKSDCVQLHYIALLIMDIALTFNLFPLRIFTILGSQAKDSLGEELHFEIGPLEKKKESAALLLKEVKNRSVSITRKFTLSSKT